MLRAGSTRLRAFLRPRRTELVVLTLLFGAALAVRLPYLTLVPRFEDEGVDVLWGFDIAAGKHFPLTGADPYYGPLFSYLVALAFWVLGPHLLLPRLIVAIVGALTVPATYWLGRVTCSHRAGLIAALLALSSRSLISVSSHYGWSNSLSPFLATVALALCCEAYSRKSARLLVLSGLLAALTVQSHPITATIVVGIAVWSLAPSGVFSAFRLTTLCLASAAFLVGYSPVLWASASSRTVSILSLGATRPYAFMPIASLAEYLQRMTVLCASLWVAAFSGSGLYEVYSHRMVPVALGLAFLACTVGASMTGGRRKQLIAFVLLSSFVVVPVLIKSFYPRYLTYLVPLVYVLIGDWFGRLWHRLRSRDAGPAGARLTWRLQIAATASVLVMITATPLLTLPSYYRRLGRHIGTNQTFYDLRQSLRANGACRDTVLLEDVKTTEGTRNDYWAYFTVASVRYVLTLDSCPFEHGSATQLFSRLDDKSAGAWLILSDRAANTFSERFSLRKVFDVSPAAPSSADLHVALYYLAYPQANSSLRRTEGFEQR